MSGCGTTPSGITSSPDRGYLATDDESVTFVQFEQTSGYVNATIQIATLEGTAPDQQLDTRQWPSSGTINGRAIELEMPGITQESGEIGSRSFYLNESNDDGTLTRTVYVLASVDDYNAAVRHLQAELAQPSVQYR